HAFEEKIKSLMKILERNASQIWFWEEKMLRELERRLHQQAKFTLHQTTDNLSFRTKQIRSLAVQQLSIKALNLDNFNQNLRKASTLLIQKSEQKIRQLEKDIARMDPNTFFEKGYTRSEINGVPLHLGTIKTGDKMTTYSVKNIIESTIITIEKKKS
ncbi:MAG: exodeoxyribonuclease VII large subunit, partial [Cyclobacteriaceae bacterium]|nr:exodeoxyribonuclease VII large subunit [Cyclobacteriaceae bacterium]